MFVIYPNKHISLLNWTWKDLFSGLRHEKMSFKFTNFRSQSLSDSFLNIIRDSYFQVWSVITPVNVYVLYTVFHMIASAHGCERTN